MKSVYDRFIPAKVYGMTYITGLFVS